MNRTRLFCSITILLLFFAVPSARSDSTTDRKEIEATGQAIRSALAAGDVAEIVKYHHPDVRKALSFQNVLVGRDAVAADLANILRHSHLEFVENNVESLLVQGDMAVEVTGFTIRVTPLAGGQPSLFHGRTMVVYVRYKQSPTGWATIRELIQPAVN
jgi:ketosteroid isomerase-like protein